MPKKSYSTTKPLKKTHPSFLNQIKREQERKQDYNQHTKKKELSNDTSNFNKTKTMFSDVLKTISALEVLQNATAAAQTVSKAISQLQQPAVINQIVCALTEHHPLYKGAQICVDSSPSDDTPPSDLWPNAVFKVLNENLFKNQSIPTELKKTCLLAIKNSCNYYRDLDLKFNIFQCLPDGKLFGNITTFIQHHIAPQLQTEFNAMCEELNKEDKEDKETERKEGIIFGIVFGTIVGVGLLGAAACVYGPGLYNKCKSLFWRSPESAPLLGANANHVELMEQTSQNNDGKVPYHP